MSCFVALTKLMKKKKRGANCLYEFHFKGQFHGQSIAGIRVEGEESSCEQGEEYLLYLKFLKIHSGYLYAEFIKVKKVDDLVH